MHEGADRDEGGGLASGGAGGVLDEFLRGLEAFLLRESGVAEFTAGAEGDLSGDDSGARVDQSGQLPEASLCGEPPHTLS